MVKKLGSILKLLKSKRYVTLFLIYLLLLTNISTQAQVTTVTTTIIPYLDKGYKYNVVPFDDGIGFEQPDFDDSDFSIGDSSFGTQPDYCSISDIKTEWPSETDILLRKWFKLPQGVKNLAVGIAIDNDVQVFVNGYDISEGLQIHEGCPERNSFIFIAPDDILVPGANLIAVRGRDRGGPSYLDIQVNADLSPILKIPNSIGR
jgi:hypothetical protein